MKLNTITIKTKNVMINFLSWLCWKVWAAFFIFVTIVKIFMWRLTKVAAKQHFKNFAKHYILTKLLWISQNKLVDFREILREISNRFREITNKFR